MSGDSPHRQVLALLLVISACYLSLSPSNPPGSSKLTMSVRQLTSLWNNRSRDTKPERIGGIPSQQSSRNPSGQAAVLEAPNTDTSSRAGTHYPVELVQSELGSDSETDRMAHRSTDTDEIAASNDQSKPREAGRGDDFALYQADDDEEEEDLYAWPPPALVKNIRRHNSGDSPQQAPATVAPLPIETASRQKTPPPRSSQTPRNLTPIRTQGRKRARSEATAPSSPSKIPLPVGTRRPSLVDLAGPSPSASNPTSLPQYSPPLGMPPSAPWTYHESNMSIPSIPQKNVYQYTDEKSEPKSEPEWVGGYNRPSEIQSHEQTHSPEPSTALEYQPPAAYSRTAPQLPRINTDMPPRHPYPPYTSDPSSEIRELKDEFRQTTKRLEGRIQSVAKLVAAPESTISYPPKTTDYIEPAKPSRSNTQKSSLIAFSPSVRAKKIIVILDATHQQPKPIPNLRKKRSVPPRTNLKRLSDCLASEHRETGMRQLVYYLSGRGTGNGEIYSMNALSQSVLTKGTDFGVGRSLHTTIIDSYTYISYNWSPGDEIYIFGFSHGAFAARALAALLADIGVFNKAGMKNFETLYDTYFDPKYGKIRTTDDFETWREGVSELAFEMSQGDGTSLTKVDVKFLGCLDTIGWSDFQHEPSQSEDEKLWRRGYFNPRHLLLHEDIENAFHALALDEDRNTHTPLLMFRPRDSLRPLSQVWFAGSHINIGGGQLSHEIASKIGLAKPDSNELSDIVFLYMIIQTYEFLSFSKKHVNKAVADYNIIQAGVKFDNMRENMKAAYKDHWVAAKIDEDSSKAGFITRVKNATRFRKNQVRTPLRYRPHWFDDEPWSRYISGESVHASAQYRIVHHPKYIPKALRDYVCRRSMALFGKPETPAAPGEEAGPSYYPKKIKIEKYVWNNTESEDDKLYSGQKDLPVIGISAFEVLTAGGDSLIDAFSLSYKDIYRESPPVFRYTMQELDSIQESWTLKMGNPPPKTPGSTMSMTERMLALRNSPSLEASTKHKGLRIKEENAYRKEGNVKKSPRKEEARESSCAGEENKTPKERDRETTVFTDSLQPYSSRRKSSTSLLKDESGNRKGKEKHSSHSREMGGYYGDIDDVRNVSGGRDLRMSFTRNDSKEKLRVPGALMPGSERVVYTHPTAEDHGTAFGYDYENRAYREGPARTARDAAEEFNQMRARSYGEEQRQQQQQSDLEPDLVSPVEPLRIPTEPEWARKMKKKGTVYPCKFKQGRE
ncbi:hypothetical protein H072_3114 [Dactylellina haptotyla CBS 200.50]|uniref:T6SS Phospholipase effector Tle1-like catalytic domain-containing protein n=1 Tax=Dactylellina haptotyla (strain CBS 200.50) TaxID=1284197 RepID=S8BTX8_DACHA|nr:hypothetical protein H072_3114 [Dactylellina haptotyla CBS 200.50]